MEVFSCPMIAGQYLNFNGRIDSRESVLSLCCENISNIPSISFADTAAETLERFLGMRTFAMAEAIRPPSHMRYGCSQCANFQKGRWQFDPFISYVNLSMYPAPCQCRCCYCGVHRTAQIFTPEAKRAYEGLFELLELAMESGVINPDASWQISSGEISIHPYKDRIMRLIRGKRAIFYTNAFLYDEKIAENLHDNPESAINLSIDAGTPRTWHRVKGVDNFETVTSNLIKYFKNSARPGQITLKYIILPDINDTYEDFQSVVEIMKVLKVSHLTISRDTSVKYKHNDEYRTKIIGAAAYLLAMCHKNGMTNDMFNFSEKERAEIIELAAEVLQKGDV